jgi:tyrosine-protein kinase Etk/Wzc
VEQLEVPARWSGRTLTLIAGAAGRYELLAPGGDPVATGEVGRRLEVGGVFLLVSELVAREGTRFDIASVPRADMVEGLQQQIQAAERGKKTGVIRIALQGEDPLRLAQIVDAIARTYVRQNVERKSAEAAKTLEFINSQLPQLKAGVENAEAALQEYRKTRGGGVDLTLETKSALDRAAEVEKLLTQLSMQRTEMQQRFMPGHPTVESVNRKFEALSAERAALDKQMRSLPETELHAARLTRDVKVASELYVLLLNRAQELQVFKSGTVGNVRILDVPQPPSRPVAPKAVRTLIASVMLGGALGVVLAFVRRMLDPGVDDPDAIEQATGFPVVAAIPHSSAQRNGVAAKRKARGDPAIAAAQDPNDVAVESVRSLRTSVEVALSEARNNVVAIVGPSPGIGKSFVAMNLAHVAAAAGKRVLLVDADMRKGHLHDWFAIAAKTPGLSDLIRGTAAPKDVIRSTSCPDLFLIPAGTRPSNPSELLSSAAMQQVAESAMRDFDLVLFDTPPLLAVTDAALVGRLSGTTLLVLRAGKHAMAEITLVTRRLEQNAVMPWAIVLNDVMPKLTGSSRYHYQYEYK